MVHAREQTPTPRQRRYARLFWVHAGLWAVYVAAVGGGVDSLSDLMRDLALPFYAVAAVLLGVDAVWTLTAGRRLRRRQQAAGLCRQCRYDLRASTDRCPECGRLITAADRRAREENSKCEMQSAK